MNIFTDVLFLFVYIMTLLYFRIPDVANNSYLTHKFYLFLSIFGYYYVIQMIKKVKNKCKIEPYDILKDSINMSLFCVLGYSIYVDMVHMDQTKSYFGDITTVDINKRFIVIALIMTIFVTVLQLVKMMFKVVPDECD